MDEEFERLSTCKLRISMRVGEEAKVSVKALRQAQKKECVARCWGMQLTFILGRRGRGLRLGVCASVFVLLLSQ